MPNILITPVSTLPASLDYGEVVNFNGTLYAGREDRSVWPFKGYKELELVASQSVSNAPTITIIRNEITSESPTITYEDVGSYQIEFGGTETLFPVGKTFVYPGAVPIETNAVVQAETESPRVIKLGSTQMSNGSTADGILNNTSFLIKVYP